MLRSITFAELVVCWFAWMVPFFRVARTSKGHEKVTRAPIARLGILFQMISFALAFSYLGQMKYPRPAAALIAAMVLAPLAVLLAWAATLHLGKQWRIDAALRSDHELVQTGPYCNIRHPIYTSMLLMLLAACCAWTRWPLQLVAVPLFLIGMEIRIHAEERLLSQRFGDAFTAFRARVPAYVPFVR